MRYVAVVLFLMNAWYEDERNGANSEIHINSKIQAKIMKAWRKSREAWKRTHSIKYALPPLADQIRQDYEEATQEFTTANMKQVMAQAGRAAFYLRLFKKVAKDPRNNSSIPLDAFPTPPLEQLDFTLAPQCRRSFFACLRIIDTVFDRSIYGSPHMFSEQGAEGKTALWQSLTLVHRSLLMKPFVDMHEYFKFGLTASYFMCWMTLLQLPLLRYLPYCEVENRWFIGYTKQYRWFIEEKFREKAELDDNVFAMDYLDQVPFRCALYSFCPDPCCRRIQLVQDNCTQDERNICTKQEMEGCQLSLNHNENFNDLMKNRLNISCKCLKRGERYDPESAKCVDVDECAEMRYTCVRPNTICVNTIGSYVCACQAGYKEAEGYCTRDLRMIEEKLPRVFGNAGRTIASWLLPIATVGTVNAWKLKAMNPRN